MSHTHTGMRVAGGWLAIASLLLAGGIVLHGPINPDMGHQMQVVADSSTRWAISHWASAAGLSLFAVTGLIVLAARSRLTEAWWTMSAWAVLAVGALWTMTTAVAEATVVADAAASGNVATYEAWWAFPKEKPRASCRRVGGCRDRRQRARTTRGATPVWASWIAAVAGIGRLWLGAEHVVRSRRRQSRLARVVVHDVPVDAVVRAGSGANGDSPAASRWAEIQHVNLERRSHCG